jgi:hypothetical protein
VPKERIVTLIIIKEMQIKTSIKNYLTPISMAIIEGTENNKFFGKDIENLEQLLVEM